MNTKKLGRLLSMTLLAVALVAILAVSAFADLGNAPTGISDGGNGTLAGLVDGNYYQIAPVTVSADGTAVETGEWVNADSATTGLAGLYRVRFTNEAGDDFSAASDLIYVYGAKADRADVGVAADGALPRSGFAVADFYTGKWSTISKTSDNAKRITVGGGEFISGADLMAAYMLDVEASVINDVAHGVALADSEIYNQFLADYEKVTDHYEYQAGRVAPIVEGEEPVAHNAAKLLADAQAAEAAAKAEYDAAVAAGDEDVDDKKAALDAATNLVTIRTKAQTRANIGWTQISNTYNAMTATVEKLNALENVTAEDVAVALAAKDAKYSAILTHANNVPITYAYNPDEIIKASELESFQFKLSQRIWGITYEGFSSRIDFYTTDLEGNVEVYPYTTAATSNLVGNGNANTVNVDLSLKGNWEKDIPGDVYILGMKIYVWSGVNDVDKCNILFMPDNTQHPGNNYPADEPCDYGNNFYNSIPNFEPIPTSYTISDPVYPKLEGIEGGFGEIKGLDENASYQYAQFVLNSDGTGLTVNGEWTDLGDTVPSGILAIRKHVATDENGTKLYTEQSDFIYVYGSNTGRQDAFTADVTKNGVTHRGISVNRGKYNQFLAGVWTGKYGDYLDGYNSFFSSGSDLDLYGKEGINVQYAHALYLEYQIVKALNENDAATAASVLASVNAHLTNLRASIVNATPANFKFRYQNSIDLFEDIVEKYTGAASATNEQVRTAKANYDAVAAGLIERAQSIAMKYAYNPDEIININEISYFKFRAAKRYSSFSYEGSFASDVVVYVADMDGKITTHKYTTEANTKLTQGIIADITNYEVSFTNKGLWTPALPETGYVVGLEVFPWGQMDDHNKIYNYVINSDRTDTNVYWSTSAGFRLGSSDTAGYLNTPTNFYGITTPVTNETLEGVSGGTGEILGIDTDAEYVYATYTINSDGSALVESAWQSLDLDNIPTGLVSIKKLVAEFDGVEIYTRPTDVFYVAAPLSQMNKNLGVKSDNTLNTKQQNPYSFIPGTWTAGSISAGLSKLYYDNYVVYEQGMGTPAQTQLVWLYEHTEEEAMALLTDIIVANEKITNADFTAADITEELRKTYAFYHNICCFYDDDTTEDFSFNFGSQPKIAAGINAGITYGSAEWEAKELAAKQGLANELQVRSTKYGFLTNEIVPVENAKTITLYKQQTGSANVSFNAVMSATFYVYNDGVVTPYTAKAPSIKCTTAQTYQVNLESLIPQEGYIVAVELHPYAEVDAKTVTVIKTGTETNGNPVQSYKNLINYRFFQNHARIGFVKDSFSYAYGALEGIRVENGEIIGLDANATYQYAYVALNAQGTELTPHGNWASLDQSNLPTGLIAIRQEVESGMYTSNVILYVPVEEAKNIIHLNSNNTLDYNTDTRPSADYRAVLNFVPLKWNYFYASGAFKSTPYSLGSGSQLITHQALTDAKDDPEAFAKASADMVKAFGEWYFTYAYGGDEVIPMTEIGSISYTIVRQQACFLVNSGYFSSRLDLVVLTDDGEIEIRSSVAKKIDYWNRTKLTFTLDDFAKTDGLVLGMVIYPYAEASEDISLKWYQAGNPNAFIIFDPVDYVIKSESTAPAFKVEKDSYGYTVTITNAIADAYYEYSTDNKNWTTLEQGESVFAATTTEVYYVRVAEKGVYHASNTVALDLVNYVFADKPELVLDEGNTITVDDGIYEYYKVSFGESAEYADLSSTTLTTGLWAIRVKATAAAGASECQYIYVPGEDVGTLRLVTQANSADAGFVSGAWTGRFATMYTRNKGASAELHLNTGNTYTLDERRAYNLKYQFTDDEIIPLDDAIDIVFNKISFYHGYLADGYSLSDVSVFESRIPSAKGQTMARVYVVGGDAPYYDVVTEVTYNNGFKFGIGSALKGKEGYITAIELYPLWSIYGPDNKTDLGDDCISACFATNTQTFADAYTYKLEAAGTVIANEAPAGETIPDASKWEGSKLNNQLGLYSNGENRYAITFALQASTVPTIAVKGSQVTVTNYNVNYDYAYSIDGDTWTEFEGNYFLATKPSTEYYVKVVENGMYSESAPSEPITTSPAIVAGASLVLDGQIGLKLYIDVADDVVVDTLKVEMTRNNADYDDDVTGEDYGAHFRKSGVATLESGSSFSSKVCYDEALDLYYVILYTAAKDVDNVHFEHHIYLNGNEEENNCYGMGGVKVCDYIDAAKALAEAGNEEFVAALDLINNIENYTTYADNYFGKGTLEAYTSDAANAEFAAPTRTADLPGLSFAATSLVLEDNVTIRHYFTVTDAAAFDTYTSAIDYKVKGDYVYYDITDIAAQDIGAAETLTINDANGNPIYSVTYSVANYIQNMLDSDDANLVSLVNAMYDYYVAASEYLAK